MLERFGPYFAYEAAAPPKDVGWTLISEVGSPGVLDAAVEHTRAVIAARGPVSTSPAELRDDPCDEPAPAHQSVRLPIETSTGLRISEARLSE